MGGRRRAVGASDDPIVQVMLLVDGDGRALRQALEEEVESLVTSGAERIAVAKFALDGTRNYPGCATFTLRLSYGAVKGYDENGATSSR